MELVFIFFFDVSLLVLLALIHWGSADPPDDKEKLERLQRFGILTLIFYLPFYLLVIVEYIYNIKVSFILHLWIISANLFLLWRAVKNEEYLYFIGDRVSREDILKTRVIMVMFIIMLQVPALFVSYFTLPVLTDRTGRLLMLFFTYSGAEIFDYFYTKPDL